MSDFVFSKDEREVLESVLDEQERTYIQQFVDDEGLFEAIKKVLLIPLYNWGTLKKGQKPRTDVNYVNGYLVFNDVNLGQQIRATANAMFYIEKGFELLQTLKKQQKEKVGKNENPAI